MRIAVASDLHLEHDLWALPPAVLGPLAAGEADVLVLAGDVSSRAADVAALASQVPADLPVLYVLGNHEHYGRIFPFTAGKYREALAPFPNWRLLEREAVVIGSVRFLGCTMWTDFAGGKHEQACMDGLADFWYIHEDDMGRKIRPEFVVQEFRRSVSWLEERFWEGHGSNEGPTVVITHHAPSFRSNHPRYAWSNISGGFCADLDEVIEEHQPALWVHGHLHDPADYQVGGTRVVCNPRGVPGERGSQFGLIVAEV